jgi:flavin-binding protein dodecin
MAEKKTIVLVGSSETSWEEAVRQVVRKASESVERINGIDVLHQSAEADTEGRIVEFRATVQISFDR